MTYFGAFSEASTQLFKLISIRGSFLDPFLGHGLTIRLVPCDHVVDDSL